PEGDEGFFRVCQTCSATGRCKSIFQQSMALPIRQRATKFVKLTEGRSGDCQAGSWGRPANPALRFSAPSVSRERFGVTILGFRTRCPITTFAGRQTSATHVQNQTSAAAQQSQNRRHLGSV